ncbi:MAG: murein biosynthesis integral membrane protein MurJ [Alphaproteobacteria bacterium]|nr:murein biosynthesis integral membrane protein MurJ [Alphaproteobacteria bacterium]
MQLLRAATTVGGYTALSRITGLIREILMSHVLGASLVADAFVVAFKFPNFFRRFFAEGAFNAAFVPQFAGRLAKDGFEPAKILAEQVFSAMAWFLLVFVIVVEIFAVDLMPYLAPGFITTPERLTLAVEFTRITFPYIMFISLSALLAGVLNSIDRFAAAAAAPILLNVMMIGALLVFPDLHMEPGFALSASVFIAGVVQFLWLYWVCTRAKVTLRLKLPVLTEDVKKVLKLMIPGTIGAGVMQINLLVDMILASLLPTGALSYLYYADRLNQLPLSIFGVAIGTALLPPLSRYWRKNEVEKALATQSTALEIAMQLTIPAAVGLVVLSYPLIKLIFGHGHFTLQDVAATAPALAAFALGLPAYVAGKVFSTTYFAREDTTTPVKVAIICVISNFVMNLIFMKWFLHVGMALATSLAAWINVVILGVLLKREGLFTFSRQLLFMTLKIIVLSAAMAGVLIYGQEAFPNNGASLFGEIGITLGYVFLGIIVYIIGGYFIGVKPWARFKDRAGV